jgi:peptidoglycan/xylan/chitin deacetylase (PgdA/CDA1 family)
MNLPMSHSRQHASILLLHYLGYSMVRNLLFRLRNEPLTRFVTFHDVADAEVANFKSKLNCLAKTTNVVSIDDYFAGRLSVNKINVVITFDDGYKSWISTAAPLLRELNMPATFFVTSGFLDLTSAEAANFIRLNLRANPDTTGALSSEDLRKIVEQGFTAGGHTLNHLNLAKMCDRAEVRREIILDKQKIESITRSSIKYFAYPFGEYHNPNTDLASLLKELGYEGAVTLIPGFNRNGVNPYCLCRELTGVPMSSPAFKARVFGAYDGINSVRRFFALKCYQTE